VFVLKIFRMRYVWEIDRFHSKLVSFDLDKHTSLNKQTHEPTKESVNYESTLLL
jgi:hypothetical protein